MSEGKRHLMKPTLATPFHIDFEWWQQTDNDWHVHLQSLLCADHQALFADWQGGSLIDWVDPETGEVKPVDGLQHMLMIHCAQQPDFLSDHTAMVESVFRVFLANGNSPMSSEELSARLGRPAETILRTLAGPRVYRGLRPCL